MKNLFLILLLMFGTKAMTIFNFDESSSLSNWMIVNDVVMGGRSDADLSLNKAGHAVFSGEVSLENNGGFASVRHRFPTKDIEGYTKAVIRLKGDGKRYQFRVKSQAGTWYSYITYFETTGEWQTVELNLKDLYPTFRGRELNMPNYKAEQLSEITFLIANKKEESFSLELAELILK